MGLCTSTRSGEIRGPLVGYSLQGTPKKLFPGCVNIGWKSCCFLPAVGKQNATRSPNFTQPGKGFLEVPCTGVVISFGDWSSLPFTCREAFIIDFSTEGGGRTRVGVQNPANFVDLIYGNMVASTESSYLIGNVLYLPTDIAHTSSSYSNSPHPTVPL